MMDYEKILWDISERWNINGFDSNQYTGCLLYVLCLRKMVEDNTCKNPEYMSRIIELTKVLYRPVSKQDITVLRESVDILEETCRVKSGLLQDVMNPLRSQEEAWNKAFIEIISYLSVLNLTTEKYYDFAEWLIYKVGKDGRSGAEKVSSNAVADLLSVAANVKDGETVLDGSIGYGYSVMKSVKGKENVTVYGKDININSMQVATMLMILQGKVNFEVTQDDFTVAKTICKADKVVMDIPFGLRTSMELIGKQKERVTRWMDTDTCKEMEALFMASALDSMKEDGRFVVIVPQGILFKQTKALSNFRRNLVKKGLLKAVVSLPPVYNSTNISTALLVFEKGNKDVLFVDASCLFIRERRGNAVISEKNKAQLGDILESKEEVEKLSFLVPNEKVLEVSDWSIVKYRDAEDELELRSMKEINSELSNLYKRFDELTEESKNYEIFK